MPDRDDRRWRDGEQEPEPDWAEQIRAGRRARGDRLRDVFARFDDDDAEAGLPSNGEPTLNPRRAPSPSPTSGETAPDGPYDQDLESPA